MNGSLKDVIIVYKMTKERNRHLLDYYKKKGGEVVYLYNVDTGTLHMEGYCPHGNSNLAHVKVFKTEKEAFELAGQKIHWCRICQKKREEKLKKV